MRRAVTLGVVVVAAAVLTFLALDRGAREPTGAEPRRDTDSVWYHASDVSQLATTGRPQLVEFFHPD